MNKNNRESLKIIHQNGHQQPVEERHMWKLVRLDVFESLMEILKSTISPSPIQTKLQEDGVTENTLDLCINPLLNVKRVFRLSLW